MHERPGRAQAEQNGTVVGRWFLKDFKMGGAGWRLCWGIPDGKEETWNILDWSGRGRLGDGGGVGVQHGASAIIR